jgi:hypothetical protein
MTHALNDILRDLIRRLREPSLKASNVIMWGCPVPSFGDICTATVATLGLNPSNREFVDDFGNELEGPQRRLHTLRSLGIERWDDAEETHLSQLVDACRYYFAANPYLGWFGDLEEILAAATSSYLGAPPTACHLDLIPYATTCKWTELTIKQRSTLLDHAGDTLGQLLRASAIRVLVVNGMTVVRNLEKLSGVIFEETEMKDWTLPRRNSEGVIGLAYRGKIHEVAGVKLSDAVQVVGYNHNIQSSFGVTKSVKVAIRDWVSQEVLEVFGEGSGQGALSRARYGTSLFPCESARIAGNTESIE